jgi:hypothetical protein
LVHYARMFVRWHLHRSQDRIARHRKRKDREARLRAILVEAVRIDGKPRQRHIAYLGSIRHDCTGKVDYRVRFWRDARKAFDRLGKRLTAAGRTRVEELIGERVRRPTAQQEKAWAAGRAALFAGFKTLAGRRRPTRSASAE